MLTATDIDDATGIVNLQILRRQAGFKPNEELVSEETGLDLFLRFCMDKDQGLWLNFQKLDIFPLFTIQPFFTGDGMECSIDFGKDYVSAAKMVSTILQEVYGLSHNTQLTYNTWTEGDDAVVSPQTVGELKNDSSSEKGGVLKILEVIAALFAIVMSIIYCFS